MSEQISTAQSEHSRSLTGHEIGTLAVAEHRRGEYYISRYFAGETDDPQAAQGAIDRAKEHADSNLDVLVPAAKKVMEADLKNRST